MRQQLGRHRSHHHHHHDYRRRRRHNNYVVNINGSRFQKQFARSFLSYVCGGSGDDIDRHVRWDRCTRKRLTIASKKIVSALLALHRRVYWPDGTLFKCSLRSRHENGDDDDVGDDDKNDNYHRIKRSRSTPLLTAKRSSMQKNFVETTLKTDENEDTVAVDEEALLQQFIDVDICDDDDDENNKDDDDDNDIINDFNNFSIKTNGNAVDQ
uniref:Late expression factor-6 n=1 Tax=Lymantria dispar multicapsid nuclear polyhedrosis virus TaxID=10449 RepID=A0A1B1MQR0_NPVLD|nr:late expression factor-6 [Lymantria dispar multiple nucleopolyhedrovirus]